MSMTNMNEKAGRARFEENGGMLMMSSIQRRRIPGLLSGQLFIAAILIKQSTTRERSD